MGGFAPVDVSRGPAVTAPPLACGAAWKRRVLPLRDRHRCEAKHFRGGSCGERRASPAPARERCPARIGSTRLRKQRLSRRLQVGAMRGVDPTGAALAKTGVSIGEASSRLGSPQGQAPRQPKVTPLGSKVEHTNRDAAERRDAPDDVRAWPAGARPSRVISVLGR